MRALICLLGISVGATAAAAEPCVSPRFDQPLPGAENVVSHVSDVPSARFPAFWQTGTLDGARYTIFSTAEGRLRPLDQRQDWDLDITCDVAGQSCTTAARGVVPNAARATADWIGQCLISADPTPQPDVPPAPETPVALPPVPDLLATNVSGIEAPTQAEPDLDTAKTVETPVPTACGVDKTDEATDVATLQRLLTMAGTDPGPVDGFLGPKSFAAMEEFVEGANWGTSISDTIAVLDAHLCNAQG